MDRQPYEQWNGSGGNSGRSWLESNGWGGDWQQQGEEGGRQQQRQGGFNSSFWDDSSSSNSYSSSSMWGPTDEELAEAKRQAAERGDYEDNRDCDVDMSEDSAASSVTAATASSSTSSRFGSNTSSLSSLGWLNTLNRSVDPQLKAKFKPLTVRKESCTSVEAASSSAAAAGGEPLLSAGFKPAVAISTPAASPYLKRIRFVKAKHLPTDEKSSTTAATSDAPSISKVGSRISLLSRGLSAAASTTKSVSSPHATPSLLAPFKKLTPGAAAKTSAPLTPAAASSASTSGFSLAHVFRVTYCTAGKKKKHYKEGYLHVFRSALATAAAGAAAGGASAAASAFAASAAVVPQPPSFLKSHIYSNRGHLIDEQIGRSVMQYDESSTRPPPKRASNPFGGSMWDSSSSSNAVDGHKKGKRKRQREDESSSDSDEENDSFGFGPAPPVAPALASTPSELLSNVFAAGERVILGKLECDLEEEISKEEYEKEKKLTTGELTAAPLSRFSSKTSIAVTGDPIPPENIGSVLLHKQGLLENGGVIGSARGVINAIKDPIALVWHQRDSRPGIGFKEKERIIPPHVYGEGRGGRGGGRGNRGGRGGRGGSWQGF